MSSPQSEKGILLTAGTNEVEFLLIILGEQRYGINVSKVCQILVLDESMIARIPNQQPQVIGVTTFRDKTISVIDLRQHLGIKAAEEPARRLLLVTEFNQRTTGFIVDGVAHIERCSWKQFEPLDETSCDATNGCVVGTVRLQSGIVVILDVETVMISLDPTMIPADHTPGHEQPKADRAAIRILHADDSAIIQKTLRKAFMEAGYTQIQTFASGADALEYLQASPNLPVDIILSDIEMPQMDGLTFCKRAKEDPRLARIPFFFFSSMINEQMSAKCHAVGGDGAYSKPELHHLMKAVDIRFLEKKTK